jgi:two-component system, NarL family, sensor histidine kinase BarA
MSYRNFNHLLGGTSLEQKCRFFFGMGILVVVSGSFFWYGQRAESLVRKQTTQTARMLVNPTLLNIHYKALLRNTNFARTLDARSGDLQSLDDLPNHEACVLDPYGANDTKKQPRDEFERQIIARFARSATTGHKAGLVPELSRTFADGSPTWAERITNGKKEFQYIQAVFFKPRCLMACHGPQGEIIDGHRQRPAPDGRHRLMLEDGDLAGAVVINLPMEQTYKAINNNRATLITAALVTAILAMFSSAMIVRYVIVKPLQLDFAV